MTARRALITLLVVGGGAGAAAVGCGRAPAVAARRQASSSAGASSSARPAPSSSQASATPAPLTAGPPPGEPAPPFAAVLPLLAGAGPPVYLPSWLPAPPAAQTYDLTGEAAASGYRVDIAVGSEPAAVQGLPAAPLVGEVGSVAGGAPGQVGAAPAFASPAEAPQPVPLGGGIQAAYYPQVGSATIALLEWQVGGWRFQVADTTGLGASAQTLTTDAHTLAAGLPADGDVVPGIAAGSVVQTLAPDGAPTWVVWRQGPWQYALEVSNGPAVRMAASMVAVTAAVPVAAASR